MVILGIETSCDETSSAIVSKNPEDTNAKILSHIVASSLSLHAETGGIIPEAAAREQVKFIIPVITKTLKDSNLYPPSSKNYLLSSTIYRPNIDAIAVTVGPGLIGSLMVGVETAKTLAYVWNKPIIPVNHLIGHIYANFIKNEMSFASVSLRAKSQRSEAISTVGLLRHVSYGTWLRHSVPRNNNIDFPLLALIVSGGHTDLVLMKKHGSIKWLGGTRDDAAGEAFDKIGRLLGLPYPGGPSIEKAAKNGNPKAFNFPRPMIDSNDFDFSFSGLKTAVLRQVKTIEQLSNETIVDLSASVQQAIIDVLVTKTLKAAQKYKVKSILLSGGVAANDKLRDEFRVQSSEFKVNFFAPEKKLCTDNGAMIASAAFFNYKPVPWQKLTANPELYFDT
ncbi:MAG: tRNA (adenosine(37)-N6)-threonylcarbamoyltransferase complex transferase subunit TsaD [Patescibacteria group bacterium]